MEAPVDQAIDTGEVLVAQKFQRVVNAFKEYRIVDLQLGDAAQVGAVVAQ